MVPYPRSCWQVRQRASRGQLELLVCCRHLTHVYVTSCLYFVVLCCIAMIRTKCLLFHSVLFHSIPFLFQSILFYSIPFHSILFHSIPFYSILFYSFPLYSIPFCSILIYSILLYGLLFATTAIAHLECNEGPRAWTWIMLKSAPCNPFLGTSYLKWVLQGLCLGEYIGIMEKKIETSFRKS